MFSKTVYFILQGKIRKRLLDEKQINITSSPHYVEDKNEIVLNSIVPHIDFGLSQKYLNKNGTHIEPGLPALYGPGTIEFMSRNAHKNQILSRRDDIEGIGYLILYFMRGTLPWTEDLGTDDYHGVSDVVHQKKVDFRAEVCLYHLFISSISRPIH